MIRRILLSAAAVLCVVNLPNLAFAQLGNLFGQSTPTVSVKEILELQENQKRAEMEAMQANKPAPKPTFILVDVRSEAEIAVSIIPGAITKEQYEGNRDQYRGMTIIPYCTVGGRSGQYCKTLEKAEVSVKNFKGSILEWVGAEQPLVTLDGTPTNRVHTYSSKYKIPAKYQQVW